MKHIRILSLSLAILMLLTACGKSESESSSVSQSDTSISLPEADVSTPDVSAPDASQPEEEALAPEVKPEEKPEAPVKPEQKPVAPAVPENTPEATPEETPDVPEAKPEEQPEQEPAAPEQAPTGVDLNAFFETIFTDPDNAPALLPMEAEALDAFYPGLNAISLKQKVAYMPMMTAVPCEIVMVECANAADVDAVKSIFRARIDTQVNDHFNYPMVIEAWETEATVVSNGNFVALLVISGMTEQVVSNFNALF